MNCNVCGNEMLETDKFCGRCGTPNPLIQSENEPADMTAEEVKEKRTCSLTAVIVCVVVIFLLSVACGIFAGLYFSVRATPEAVRYSTSLHAEGSEG